MPPGNLPVILSHAQLEVLDKPALIEAYLELAGFVYDLAARVQALEERLAQNSRNSSLPPSSEGLQKPAVKPKPKSLREKGRRSSGGQPGHPGRTLERVERPDRVEVHALDACPCGHCLNDLAAHAYEVRQVFEVPAPRLEVTEHRAEVKRCPHCLSTHTAPFPPGVTAPVQYGARARALAVYLNEAHFLSLARVREFFACVFGYALGEATVEQARRVCYAELVGVEEDLREALGNSPVLHADETGLRTAGRLYWVHVQATATHTLYSVSPRRGGEGMRASGVLEGYAGVLVHDCWAPYFRLCSATHAVCNAHLLRELKFVDEELAQPWAGRLAQLLREMKQAVEDKAGRPVAPATRAAWGRRYAALLEAGRGEQPPAVATRGRCKKTKAHNLLDRLEKHAQAVLAFTEDPRVPFTNNRAEQDLRMVRVRQKVAGCFRTLKGARRCARIRSYLSTLTKQGHNLLEALVNTLRGHPTSILLAQT